MDAIVSFSHEMVSYRLTKIVAVVFAPVADVTNSSLMITMLVVYFLQM